MKTSIKSRRAKRAKQLNAAILQFANDIQTHEGIKLPLCQKRRKPRQLLTTEQAAKRLGRKKHTIENWRSIGVGPVFHKVGGRILYNRADLIAYLEDRKFNSTSAYFAQPTNKEAK